MDKFALEVLDKVDGFYSSSFSQLITITLGLVAFLGVFVPVLTTYYQNRNTKIEKKNLEDFIENKLAIIRQELLVEIRGELLKNYGDFERKHNAELERALGGIGYVQANHQLSKSEYKEATESILCSISSCIKAFDEINLQRGLNILIYNCLPYIPVEGGSDLTEIEDGISQLKLEIQDLNSNGRYADSIAEIEKSYRLLVKKQPISSSLVR